jgi:hypothetical protein
VPKQYWSGGKDKPGGISCLRSLFIAGALAVIRYAKIPWHRAAEQADELAPPHVLPSNDGLSLPHRARRSRLVHHSEFARTMSLMFYTEGNALASLLKQSSAFSKLA